MDDKSLTTEGLRGCYLAGVAALLLIGPALNISFADSADNPISDTQSGDDRAARILQTQFKQPAGNNQNRGNTPSGTSSTEAKRAAIAELPLDKLKPADRRRVKAVIDSVGMFRRLPTVVFSSDPEAYEYFVRHPDVVASIWRAMRISKLQMWQTGRFEYEGDAHDGTIGTLDVVHQSPNQNLVICKGEFKSPLIPKPIKATSVILLRTNYFKEPNGVIYVTHSADLFVSFPSQTVDSIAKILAPWSGRIADRTFGEISLFLRMMSMAMGKRPGWVEQIVGKLEGVPKLRREQLLKLTAQVYTAELKRQGKLPLDISKQARPAPKGKQAPTTARLGRPKAERPRLR